MSADVTSTFASGLSRLLSPAIITVSSWYKLCHLVPSKQPRHKFYVCKFYYYHMRKVQSADLKKVNRTIVDQFHCSKYRLQDISQDVSHVFPVLPHLLTPYPTDPVTSASLQSYSSGNSARWKQLLLSSKNTFTGWFNTRTSTFPFKGNTWNSDDPQWVGRRKGWGKEKQGGLLTDPAFRRFGSGVNLPPLPARWQTIRVVERWDQTALYFHRIMAEYFCGEE